MERPIIGNLVRDYGCKNEEAVFEKAKKLGVRKLDEDLFEITANTSRFYLNGSMPKKLAVVVTGVSGGGKDCIVEELEKTGLYQMVRTYTTRERRARENNELYHRVSQEEFLLKLANGEFLEYCRRGTEFMGMAREDVDDVLKKGKIPTIRTGPQALKGIDDLLPDLQMVNFFVIPESWSSLRRRLVVRDLIPKEPSERDAARQDVRQRLERNKLLLNYIEDTDFLLINRSGCLSDCARHVMEVIDDFTAPRQLLESKNLNL